MALTKVDYVNGTTVIMAENLNAIQDEIIANGNAIGTQATQIAGKASTSDLTAETTAREAADTALTGEVNNLKSAVNGVEDKVGYNKDLAVLVTTNGAIKYSDGSPYTTYAAISDNYKFSGFVPVRSGDVIDYLLRTPTGYCMIAFYTDANTSGYVQANSVEGTGGAVTGQYAVEEDGYVRVTVQNDLSGKKAALTRSGEITQEVDAINNEVDAISNTVGTISGESYNMFAASDVTIGTNGTGATGFPKRAISKAYDGGSAGLTVSCKNLPANLKYEVDGYTDENFGGLGNMSGGWVTAAGTVTIVTTKRYIRILFGSVDNANLTEADFDGLELQIEAGQGASAYAPHITAVDYVARNKNEITTRVRSCTYNVGLYSYGLSQNDPPADATTKLIAFLSDYGFDLMGLQECRDTLNGANVNSTVYQEFFFNQANGSTPPRTAIKTQYQLTDIGSGTFTAGSRPYIYGTAMIGNKEVFVMSVHFALTAEDRASNYTELLAILAQHDRFIVFGDFNAANETAAEGKAAQAQAEYNNLINAGYTVANGGRWGLLSTVHNVTNYLDNVVVSQNIKMTSAKVLDVYDEMTSDHLPLEVDLVI